MRYVRGAWVLGVLGVLGVPGAADVADGEPGAQAVYRGPADPLGHLDSSVFAGRRTRSAGAGAGTPAGG
ncbi:hypothetical protein [Streptomyces sp. NPDC101776]|uniref:hypothetical protein n=1 Tax=Streptomyces sp. NPDC101776 TaxID=3366146 RepID=UPI00380C4098